MAVRLNPQINIKASTFFDSLSEEERKGFIHFQSKLAFLQYEMLMRVVEEMRDKGSRILDWGAGNCFFSFILRKKGFLNVVSYGYGWGREIPDFLTKDLFYIDGNDMRLESPSTLPFEKEEFDVVFSVGVLEHVHETGGSQEKSLSEISRVLKRGGKFICLHLPNKYTWIEFTKDAIYNKVLKKGAHIHTKKFDKGAIRRLFVEAGFSVVELKRYNFLPYNSFRRIGSPNSFVLPYFLVDTVLSRIAGIFCQNFLVVAEKRNDLPDY